MDKLSVVIADDHQIIRDAVRRAFTDSQSAFEFDVVAETENGLETVVAVREHTPDILVLDITMPLATGAEIVSDLLHWSPNTNILVLTGIVAPGLLATMVNTGVQGIFSKTAPVETMIETIPIILKGANYIAPELVQAIEDGQASSQLTQRETQTLNMMLRGKSTKEMAELMFISPKTAEKHRASLKRKLNVNSTAELLARALEDGLIGPT
ncbi:MAG: response regulator transcription factor [Granulosicoccus sp.]|nr:response regulator transcription factor [Granulosicoccus sp.]